QVNYVFTDKTGTLTENIMLFRQLSVCGQKFLHVKDGNRIDTDELLKMLSMSSPRSKKLLTVASILSSKQRKNNTDDLNDDIIPTASVTQTGDIIYQASSPDEFAIANTAKDLGYTITDRSMGKVSLRINDLMPNIPDENIVLNQDFQILNILEFSSKRKRMSVICADSVILDRLRVANEKDAIDQKFDNDIDSGNPVDNINNHMEDNDPSQKQKLRINTNLDMTRILNDDKTDSPSSIRTYESDDNWICQQTMRHLHEFAIEGLRTLLYAHRYIEEEEYIPWNKQFQEASNLLTNKREKLEEIAEFIERDLELTGATAIEDKLQRGVPETIDKLRLAGIKVWMLTGDKPHIVVVIDGDALMKIEQDAVVLESFLDFIREKLKTSVVTLAIGDGANDIAMIQEAHVGIGITGREGLQAARSSDYSISQFRFLENLLFVHGRWSYIRVSKFALGTLYKCMCFYLTQGLFQLFTAFSGTSLYEQWSLASYNTLFTSLPVMVIGVFEKDLNYDTLIAIPSLYKIGQENKEFNLKIFFSWMIGAICHAIAIVSVPILLHGYFQDYEIRIEFYQEAEKDPQYLKKLIECENIESEDFYNEEKDITKFDASQIFKSSEDHNYSITANYQNLSSTTIVDDNIDGNMTRMVFYGRKGCRKI
ncbi:18975_t:CDS:2, partial [Racocetra fulgida]